jgi:hypothetical protein
LVALKKKSLLNFKLKILNMNNTISQDIWLDYSYELGYEILSDFTLRIALYALLHKELCSISNNNYILIQLKIRTKENQYKSISYLQRAKKSEFKDLLGSFVEFWELKSENYKNDTITHIIFTYKILPLDSAITKSKINKPLVNILSEEPNKTKDLKTYGYSIPITMDFTEWGDLMYETDKFAIVQRSKTNSKYFITISDDNLKVDIMMNDKILLSFKDTINNKEGNLLTFTRQVKNNKYVFEDGELVFKKVLKKLSFLKPIKRDKFMSDKIITMDLETREIDCCFWPYCISIFDGKKDTKISFYLADYDNCDSMISASVKYLMKERYNKHKVYLHNFSYFDSVFLITTLSNLSDKIEPTIRDGRIINFKFNYKKHYYLNFRDSLLLMPLSLAKLAKAFNFESKGIFPYKFVNNVNIALDYIGKFPGFRFFDFNKISSLDFMKYKSSFKDKKWNLRAETIKYSELDCVILYKVLIEFNTLIYSTFRVDAFKYSTLSSLAFAIFRTKYLKPNTIPLIDGEIYKHIRLSYTGGACDVYKPFGTNIKGYDVNGLYPSRMAEQGMPVGNPTHFIGDISKYEEDPFGFFEVDVTAPLELNVPILQIRMKVENVYRTIAPVGSWTGWYFSEELKEAKKLGYTYKIRSGYLFEKKTIFKEFIEDLYKYKENSERNSAQYTIFKLLMNSLYGRFGMNPLMENHMILPANEASKYHEDDSDKWIVSNIIDLKNGKELISFFDLKDSLKDDNNKRKINISIPISSAITSYSRIFMSYFKNIPGINLYYSDTDSIYIDQLLDSKYISETAIGKFKLERIFKRAIFLTPKFYGGIILNKENKYTEHVKNKGLKNPIRFNKLYQLLFKNNKIQLEQEKWFRNISEANIKVNKNTKHTLKLSSLKRSIIFKNNKFVDTKPLILKDSNLI